MRTCIVILVFLDHYDWAYKFRTIGLQILFWTSEPENFVFSFGLGLMIVMSSQNL
ncbi:hypothetical protein ISN44_As05g051960 [Arabidopsis suecica]|uniref:Uncharacterized protein n=1 Tax=Arabidopsis suecica TaxID=45249 RepID=A0A8T2DSN3_ARASU|nr:hypothetical protein ISN44_As05g051960 [Arabidopsis suecica]